MIVRWSYHFRFLDEVAQVSSCLYFESNLLLFSNSLSTFFEFKLSRFFYIALSMRPLKRRSLHLLRSCRKHISFHSPSPIFCLPSTHHVRTGRQKIFHFSWFRFIHRSVIATIPRMRTALMDDASHVTSVLHSYR